jgi:hypothetical protein
MFDLEKVFGKKFEIPDFFRGLLTLLGRRR